MKWKTHNEEKNKIEDLTKMEKSRNYQCEICDCVCVSASNLEIHVKSCQYYSKFMKESSIRAHCLLCQFQISKGYKNYKYQMNEHIKKQHHNLTSQQKETILKSGLKQITTESLSSQIPQESKG